MKRYYLGINQSMLSQTIRTDTAQADHEERYQRETSGADCHLWTQYGK